jgi:hypothetical protein
LTMADRRKMAFTAAMVYGNNITYEVTFPYSNAEVQSWTAQEIEARQVLQGVTLDPQVAILPPLADHAGKSLEDYAKSVIEKADSYRQIAIAAVKLRRGAEGLLSEELDTPEKLEAAVAALKVQADEAAQQFGLSVPAAS